MRHWKLENSSHSEVISSETHTDAIEQFHARYPGELSDPPSYREVDAPAETPVSATPVSATPDPLDIPAAGSVPPDGAQ